MKLLKLVLFSYFVLYSVYAIGTALISARILKKLKHKKNENAAVGPTPHVAVVIPAYNEERTIVDTIRSALNCDYPDYNILVINDGSNDNTLEILKREFSLSQTVSMEWNKGLCPIWQNEMITVIDKLNGGKADAYNAAIEFTTAEWLVVVDADTILTPDAIRKLVGPLADPRVVAVGAQVTLGNNIVINDRGEILEHTTAKWWEPILGVQMLEYLKTFMIYRIGHNAMNSSLLISGACGLYKTQVLRAIGGFASDSVCEDIDMTIRVQNYTRSTAEDDRIDFVPDIIAYTEAPGTYRSLFKQRNRWYRGAAQSLWHGKNMLFRPSFGSVAWYSMPSYWLFGWFTPFAQLAILVLLAIDIAAHGSTYGMWELFLFGLAVALVINLLSITLARRVDPRLGTWREQLKLFWFCLVELVWMQYFYMVVNLKAAWDALRGDMHWNKFNRIGFNR